MRRNGRASWIRRVTAAAAALLALGGLAAHGHGTDPVEIPEGEPDFVSDAHCHDGFAAGFPCRHVDLSAWLPLAHFGLGPGNDLWGWTDPEHAHEFALLGLRRGLAFVDVSDPVRPVYLGHLPPATGASTWRDAKVYGGFAFVVSEAAGHGLQIFDLGQLEQVTDPPRVFTASARYTGFGSAHNVGIDEGTGFAYAVGTRTCAGGLHMVDVREPLNPLFAGCYAGDGYTHDTQCVVYAGPDLEHRGREICFNSNEDTLTIVDVSDKAAPLLLARAPYASAGYSHQGWLTEDHGHFLLGDELDELIFRHRSRTYVWDLSDLDAPVLAGSYIGLPRAIDHNLYVRGDHAFEANYRSGLRVLRLGDLTLPELAEVAFFDTYPADNAPRFSGAWSVYPFFESGTVIVSDINRGLFVLQPDLDAVPRCDDGLDNDGDGLVDHGEDPGCAGPDGADELPRNDVLIEIRPGDGSHLIKPFSRGVVAVAVLGDDGFDVDRVDGSTLSFGPTAAPIAHRNGPHGADVNGDGFADLFSHHRTEETGIESGDVRACLAWLALDGTPYESCGAIQTVR